MSLRKSLGLFTGREFHEGLFSSPTQNAQEAASATSSADNAEIANEEQYVNTAEGNLRGAIAGSGPNPYFQPPAPPAPVNPNDVQTFGAPAPQVLPQAAPQGRAVAQGQPSAGNPFAPPVQSPFAPAPRVPAQPVQRAPAPAAQ